MNEFNHTKIPRITVTTNGSMESHARLQEYWAIIERETPQLTCVDYPDYPNYDYSVLVEKYRAAPIMGIKQPIKTPKKRADDVATTRLQEYLADIESEIPDMTCVDYPDHPNYDYSVLVAKYRAAPVIAIKKPIKTLKKCAASVTTIKKPTKTLKKRAEAVESTQETHEEVTSRTPTKHEQHVWLKWYRDTVSTNPRSRDMEAMSHTIQMPASHIAYWFNRRKKQGDYEPTFRHSQSDLEILVDFFDNVSNSPGLKYIRQNFSNVSMNACQIFYWFKDARRRRA